MGDAPIDVKKDKNAVYLVINNKLSMIYLCTPKVTRTFEQTVKNLHMHGIKSIVATYEPQIKPQIGRSCKIGVYKSYEYESPTKSVSRLGGIVASGDIHNIVHPILACKDLPSVFKKLSKMSLLFIFAGALISFGVTIIGYLIPSASDILFYRDIFTLLIQTIALIPLFVGALTLLNKKK